MREISKHLIVIGGGAAGIFCAINAARGNAALRVTVLEKSGKLLSKVKVSGGGRCNVTHACFDIGEMVKRYPRGGHFVRKAFFRWAAGDTVSWFREQGVELKTEEDGRMFPVTDSSQTIIDCLMKEANRHGVEIRTHAEVRSVVADGDFRVQLASGQSLSADYVCIACGGYPKTGMFDWIRRLGHSIEEPVPSLFTFNIPGDPLTRLMGVSVPVAQVKVGGTSLVEKGPLLITHWGLSGPVVLRLSAWGARELAARGYLFGIRVNWLPEQSEQQVRERLQQVRYDWAARQVGGGNPFGFPQRLWEYWLSVAGIAAELRWADLPAREQNKLVSLLCAGEFAIAGKTTFKEEFVTAGGVRLTEVEATTCQSRKVPGLYFAGEILDVDGVTGGFNFQHAWTSGWIVADSVLAAMEKRRTINHYYMGKNAAAFAPCLTLKEVAPAVDFYKKAFGVEEVLIVKNEDGSVHVAELAFEGMTFHLHQEMPGSPNKRAPQGATTVELGVFLENPDSLMDSALAAGATLVSAMKDYEYGYRQGSFVDPFGHYWTLQKKLANAWEGVIGPDGAPVR